MMTGKIRIERMSEKHRGDVLDMSEEFYSSDAVSHPADSEKLINVFETAVSAFPTFEGYVFVDENGEAAGYSYISQYYESEIGGMCVMLIDLFVKSKYRGCGIATGFFDFIKREYGKAKRFRLEVMPDNDGAIAAYRRWGFEDLPYKQMILDM